VKLAVKRAGSSTSFSDTLKEEALLHFCWNEDGTIDMAFHLYDAGGRLVADSGGITPVVPMTIRAADGEVLLDIPEEHDLHISYRLYNCAGSLLTSSDGNRTHIFSFLRMGRT
jgi:hypothetical protein